MSRVYPAPLRSPTLPGASAIGFGASSKPQPAPKRTVITARHRFSPQDRVQSVSQVGVSVIPQEVLVGVDAPGVKLGAPHIEDDGLRRVASTQGFRERSVFVNQDRERVTTLLLLAPSSRGRSS